MRTIICCFLITIGATASLADSLQNFHQSVSAATKHIRFAQFYVRTGNMAVAGSEIDQALEQWRKIQKRFTATPPGRLAKDSGFKIDLATIGLALAQALAAADKDNGKAASDLLNPIAKRLTDMRKRNGMWVFADCVNGMNQAMDAAWVYRRKAPDFSKPSDVLAMNTRFKALAHWYQRCYKEAGAAERANPAFERLFKGSLASILRLLKAAADKSVPRIVSNLRELKSFDRLIWLHLG